MSDFKKFSDGVHNQYMSMGSHELFQMNIDKDAFYAAYLAAFPEGTNPVFRERTEHDCSCCRNFIKNLGTVVTVGAGQIQTVWDNWKSFDAPYDVVAKALRDLLRQHEVGGVYRTKEGSYGLEKNFELIDGEPKQWNHFHGTTYPRHRTDSPEAEAGQLNTNRGVFQRGLDEIKPEAVETVMDLVNSNSLYRGEENLIPLRGFQHLQQKYRDGGSNQLFSWEYLQVKGSLIRNTAIGTLLTDLSEGMELEKAVASFEKKVAPENYKRSKALITPAMIKAAVAKLAELGLEEAVERRFASINDVKITDVLWTDRQIKDKSAGGFLTRALMSSPQVKNPDPSTLRVVGIEAELFLSTIVPNADSMEVLVKNNLTNNLVSLTAPVHASDKGMFKWPNQFGWSYNGNVADSFLREQVQARGGSVDGVFRFTHSWNRVKRNVSLMDLHVFIPGSGAKAENGLHDHYGNTTRVGWNNRRHLPTGGVQDVDYTTEAPANFVPVENITFPSLDKMPDGEYVCKVHNWARRIPNDGGFEAEIEFGGKVYQYYYDKPLGNKEWVTVAVVTKRGNDFTIEHKIPCQSASNEVWGIKTETFVKVETMMLSPNFWGDSAVGNKHLFLMLEGCKNPEPTRGIYNEYLTPELNENRKVFEVLGAQTMCQPTDDQLSGIGFSSTRKDLAVIRVTNKDGQATFHVQF